MKNLPLVLEDKILEYLYKPLTKRKRCCAKTKANKVCKKNAKTLFCPIHSKLFQQSLKSSNKFESVCLKSILLRR